MGNPVGLLIHGMSLDSPVSMVIVGAGHVARGPSGAGDLDPGLEFLLHAPDRVRQAVLIEPLEERLAALRDAVPPSVRCDLIDAAVSARQDRLSLWVVGPTAQAEVRRVEGRMGVMSSGGLGWTSSDRDHVAGMLQAVLLRPTEAIIPLLEERSIPARTLTKILEDLEVGRVDYLQVDVEGADDDVIRSLDLGRYRPRLICFESAHLSDRARGAILEHLTAYGYEEFAGLSGLDTVVGLRGGSGALR